MHSFTLPDPPPLPPDTWLPPLLILLHPPGAAMHKYIMFQVQKDRGHRDAEDKEDEEEVEEKEKQK